MEKHTHARSATCSEIVLCSLQQFSAALSSSPCVARFFFGVRRVLRDFFLAAWCIALHWASSTMEHARALFFGGAHPRGMWLCMNDDRYHGTEFGRSVRTFQAEDRRDARR